MIWYTFERHFNDLPLRYSLLLKIDISYTSSEFCTSSFYVYRQLWRSCYFPRGRNYISAQKKVWFVGALAIIQCGMILLTEVFDLFYIFPQCTFQSLKNWHCWFHLMFAFLPSNDFPTWLWHLTWWSHSGKQKIQIYS